MCVYYVSVCTILIYRNVDTFELVVVYMPKWHQASRFNPGSSKDCDFHLVQAKAHPITIYHHLTDDLVKHQTFIYILTTTLKHVSLVHLW